MLTSVKMKMVEDLVNSSSREELVWINGYLNGIVSAQIRVNGSAARHPPTKNISIWFGTETGNAKKLAADFSIRLKQTGWNVKLQSLDQYREEHILKETQLLIIISTHGEGEPPSTARKFYDHIHRQGLSLGRLQFAVLALGDSSYPLFCKAGEDVYAQLSVQGARPLLPLKKCDVDFEEDALKWFDQLLHLIAAGEKQPAPAQLYTAEKKTKTRQWFEGRIIHHINLNDRSSQKETYHLEILPDEPVAYEPGDAFAIVPENQKQVVDAVIRMSGLDPSLLIKTGKAEGSLETLLTRHLNICYLTGNMVKKYAAVSGHDIPDVRMDLKDLMRIYPLSRPEQFIEMVQSLQAIAPRLYSIASSPAAHGNEIHLTVGRNSYLFQQELRFGLCSGFLGALPTGTRLRFYIHKNRSFKLPPPEADMIMIGPGTGIAPFRSFLAERDATGASGRNWLFFGEQHFTTDFLYQTEWQQWLQTGVLNRISLAFSRDQEPKIYVQDRIRETQEAFRKWINEGAFVYVSGSKTMGQEVERIIQDLLGAETWSQLKKQNRFQKDVY